MANKKSIILSHSGKQHSYYVANALKGIGVLKKFHTSSYIGNPLLQKIILERNLTFFSKRLLSGLYSTHVDSSWKYEVREFIARKVGKSGVEINNLIYRRDISFDAEVARKLESIDFDTFWGFQGSCYSSLLAAHSLGKKTVCEMTIAHLPYAQKILDEEVRLNPEWADSIDFANFPVNYKKRLIEEPQAADHVIAISSFLKETLVSEGIPEKKISVIPLGFELDAVPFREQTTSIVNRPLRLLYAGRITQRKGIKYLLEAMKYFKRTDVELHIIGNIHGSGKAFKTYESLYNYRSGVSQMEMFRLYSDYDVLVFPSILEGFGLVAIEAMGAGLPVITTANTNATEILNDKKNGFLVPIRDVSSIVTAIENIRNMDNAAFQTMRMNARKTALSFTWDQYQIKLEAFVNAL